MTAVLFVAVAWLAPPNIPPAPVPSPTASDAWTFIPMSPEDLIRARWEGTGDEDTMVGIAWRESRFDCAADNPRSSAAGLFQTLAIHRPRAERLGIDWADITGPACLADVELAWSLYEEQGTSPWRLTRG